MGSAAMTGAEYGVWEGSGTEPVRTGRLLAGMGGMACPVGVIPAREPGFAEPDGDLGQLADPGVNSTANMSLGGTTSKSGTTPVSIDYTVDLTQVAENGRIVRAKVTYTFSSGPGSPTVTVTDDGGTVTGSPFVVEWSAAGIAALNAAQRSSALAVHATASWNDGFSHLFSVTGFEVTWMQPLSG